MRSGLSNVLPALFLFATGLLFPNLCKSQHLPGNPEQALSARWERTHWGGPFQMSSGRLESRLLRELEQCKDPKDVYDQVNCSLFEGLQKMEEGQLEAGRAALGNALSLLEQENDRLGQILILVAIAEAERYFQQSETSVEKYHKAIELVEGLAQSSDPLRLESFRLFSRLHGYPDEMFAQAVPMMEFMRPMFVNLLEVMVRDNFGVMLLEIGQLKAAKHELTRAAEGSRSLMGLFDYQVLAHLAQAHQYEGDFDRADELFGQALRSAEKMADRGQQFRLYGRKAELAIERGRPAAAIEAYERALDIAVLGRNPVKEAESLLAIADICLIFLGEIPEGRSRLRQAVEAAERSGDKWIQALVYFSVAGEAFWAGRYEVAIENAEKSLRLMDEIGINKPEAAIGKVSSLLVLAQIYAHLGRPEQVLERATEALGLATQLDFPEGIAASQAMLTTSPGMDWERIDSTMSLIAQALQQSSLPRLRYFGQESGSVFRSSQAFSSTTSVGTGSSQALPILRLAQHIGALVDADRGQRFEEGSRVAGEVAADAKQAGLGEYEALGLLAKASFLWRGGQKEKAAEVALEGIDALETIVDDFRVDDAITIFMDGYRKWLYAVAVGMLANTGRPELAFDLAEQARSRALLHQLGNQRLAVPEEAAGLYDRMRGLRLEIETLGNDEAREKELREKLVSYEELSILAKLKHPESADLTNIKSATFEELRTLLPPDTALVSYYFVGKQLIAWVVDRQGVSLEKLSLDRSFESDVLCFSRRVGRSPRGAKLVNGCRSKSMGQFERVAYDQLWDPLDKHIRHESVIVVPHQELHYLPFASLRNERGQYLAEVRKLSYLPNISVLRHIDQKRTPFEGRALILGDPVPANPADANLGPLEGARGEAHSIAELLGLPGRFWVGDEATEKKIWDLQGQIDLLHIAAHGIYRPQAPRFSRIALAGSEDHDGSLEVEEVYRALDLKGVDLVTLSACQTALGELTEGDEIIGLNRAFLYAGSPAVLSTLWRVDDEATAEWMKSFYRHMLDGASYGEAVQTAQREVRAKPRFREPHYWAGFVLTGDPHRRWKEAGTAALGPEVDSPAITAGTEGR